MEIQQAFVNLASFNDRIMVDIYTNREEETRVWDYYNSIHSHIPGTLKVDCTWHNF